MDLNKYKNADLFREQIRESKKPIRSLPVSPGVWFKALLVVVFVPLWLPPVARTLGFSDWAKRVMSGCRKCNMRSHMMNNHGWRGLPRLLCRREFWTGGRKRGGEKWQKQSGSPTTATS